MAEDKRITEVWDDQKEALNETDKTYNDMISQSDSYYDKQINASKEWAETQKNNQQAQTDHTIDTINQQKDQANKDYIKEQSGAYVDWQKQSNQYGANAEKQAASGLANSGYAESSQVSMYNQYQSRVTAARESYNRAVLNYDNAIKEAQLQNSSILAEIAYKALQQQLQLSLEGFQYKNTLVLEKAKERRSIKSEHYNRYLGVLDQINKENALAEEKRQFDAQLAEQQRQFNILHSGTGTGSGKISKSSGGSKGGRSSSSSKKNSATERLAKTLNSNNIKPNSNPAEPKVNMDSVLALGYGPISAKKLNQLVESGMVTETERNGELIYIKRIADPVTMKQYKLAKEMNLLGK